MDYNSASSAGKPASQKNKLIPNNTDSVLFGKHSAKGTTCFEFAINNLVARVQLERLDRSGLGNKRKFIQMVPTNKPIKRRLPMLTCLVGFTINILRVSTLSWTLSSLLFVMLGTSCPS